MGSPFDLRGRTAIVTGANTGLGQAIALALRIQRQCVRTVEIARRSFLPNELKDRKNAR